MNAAKTIVLVSVLGQSSYAGSYLEFLLRQGLTGSRFSVPAPGYSPKAASVPSRVFLEQGANGSHVTGNFSHGLPKKGTAGPLLSPDFYVNGANSPLGPIFVSGGSLYATGTFTAVGKRVAYGVAQWNGREWKGMGDGFLDPVTSMAFSDSLAFAGGYFRKSGSSTIPYMAQWDGSRWGPVGTVVLQKPVLALAYAGGALFVGVEGKAADSVTGIASWNGKAWSSLGGGTDSAVYCLKPTATGLLAGGNFTRIGGVRAAGVAEWTKNQWHPLGAGLQGRVTEIESFGGDVFAAGYFLMNPDSSVCRFAQWNGNVWSCVEVDQEHRFSPAPVVTDLASDNGKLYASAAVHSTEASQEFQTFQFNGSQWMPMGPVAEGGIGVEYVDFVTLAAYQGQILLGGDFSKLGDKAIPGLAKWDGAAWVPWPEESSGLGVGNFVSVLAAKGAGILAGGAFSTAGGSLSNGLASFDGKGWSDAGFPDSLTANGGVIAIAVIDDQIFTASFIRNPISPHAIRVRRLRAGQWSTLGEAHGNNGQAGLGALLAWDGVVYAAGIFDTIGGVPARNIAYWDGQNWKAMGTGLNGRCRSLEWDGGFLYAGGEFDSAGGAAAHRIARWNGTAWSPLGSGSAEGVAGVSAVAVNVIRKQGGRLVVGGNFREAGGIASRNLAVWSSQGWEGNWDAYGSAVVRDIVVRDDSVLFLAYSDGMKNPGGSYTGIAKWSGKEWSPISSQIGYQAGDGGISDGIVLSLALAGNDLYAGGFFTLIDGIPSNYIARWSLSDGSHVRKMVAGNTGRMSRILLIGSAASADVRGILGKYPGVRFFDSAGRQVGVSSMKN